jgi:hypothetical protein
VKRVEKEKTKPKEQQKSFTCHVFEAPSKVHPYVDYNFLDCLFKVTAQHDYRSLPTQTSQSIMKTVFKNWKSFFSSLKDYKKNPGKYKGRSRIPKYSRANEKEVPFTSKRLEKIHQIRHRKLKDLFHKVSFSIIKHAQEENIIMTDTIEGLGVFSTPLCQLH